MSCAGGNAEFFGAPSVLCARGTLSKCRLTKGKTDHPSQPSDREIECGATISPNRRCRSDSAILTLCRRQSVCVGHTMKRRTERATRRQHRRHRLLPVDSTSATTQRIEKGRSWMTDSAVAVAEGAFVQPAVSLCSRWPLPPLEESRKKPTRRDSREGEHRQQHMRCSANGGAASRSEVGDTARDVGSTRAVDITQPHTLCAATANCCAASHISIVSFSGRRTTIPGFDMESAENDRQKSSSK